ncbi:hypothetical protein NMY22_g10487 [Coprinellus aureogranulatus]|nr:hypothetical protein NMY22_g10487 [Coprinellus aureogranulatus]
MDPLLTPDAFIAARQLDASSFQSLINFLGSRSRAGATSLAIYSASPNKENLSAFTSVLRLELVNANVLLGMAVCMHGSDSVRPSYSFRSLTRLLAHESLADFDSLRMIVEHKGDPDDYLLPYYSGNWWSDFDPTIPLSLRKLSPADLIQYWSCQQKTLPNLKVPAPLSLSLNTGSMTKQELTIAWNIASDTLSMLEDNIEATVGFLGDVTVTIAQTSAMASDLRTLISAKQADDANPAA